MNNLKFIIQTDADISFYLGTAPTLAIFKARLNEILESGYIEDNYNITLDTQLNFIELYYTALTSTVAENREASAC